MRVEDDEADQPSEEESKDVNLEDTNEALIGFSGNKADVITGLTVLKAELKPVEKKTIRQRKARKRSSSLRLSQNRE